MTVDRTLLTSEQLAEWDTWLEFFNSSGWRNYTKRFEPIIANYREAYHEIEGEQALGRLQGALRMLSTLLYGTENAVNLEFEQLARVDEEEEGQGPNDPITPDDWDV